MRALRLRLVVVLGVLSGAVLVPASPAVASVGTLLATLNDPGGLSGDAFGHAVAVSGGTAIVGAPCFGCSGAPAAYIFVKGTSGWPASPTQTLANPSTGPGFGLSVAVSGNTAVVGQGSFSGGTGAAFIYTKTASGWPATPTATLSDPAAGDGFGIAVAVAGSTVIVGAPCPGCSGGPGAAYIYVHGSSGWPASPTKTLSDPAAAGGDAFGASVEISGNTAIVGAPGTGSGGKAYLYLHGTSGWPASPAVSVSDPAATSGDGFGGSVSAKITKTVKVVTVGAPGTGTGGAAYIYVEGTAGWPASPTASVSDPAATAGDFFGHSVAVSGTVAVVGAWGTSASQGETYLYVHGTPGWPASPTVSVSDPAAMFPPVADSFGVSVAVSGPAALAGAEGTNSSRGVTYIYQS